MRIEAFILAWNEAELLPFTLKHYSFCDKITVFDNYSTDGSDRIAQGMGCEVKKFGIPGVLDDKEYLKIKNNCWKGSVADWAIVCDTDEILHFRPVSGTVATTFGFNVVSRETPKETLSELTRGAPDTSYSKLVCFNPKAVKDINYVYGCHVANPRGDIRMSEEILPLLHYRCIGGPERLVKRHRQYRQRMSELNKRLGLGCHYLYDDDRRRKEWADLYDNSVEFSSLGIV